MQEVSLAPSAGRAGSGPASPRDWRPAAPPGPARPAGGVSRSGGGDAEGLVNLLSSPGPGGRVGTPHFGAPLSACSARVAPQPRVELRSERDAGASGPRLSPGRAAVPAFAVGPDFFLTQCVNLAPLQLPFAQRRGGGVRRGRRLGFSFCRSRGSLSREVGLQTPASFGWFGPAGRGGCLGPPSRTGGRWAALPRPCLRSQRSSAMAAPKPSLGSGSGLWVVETRVEHFSSQPLEGTPKQQGRLCRYWP